MNLPTSLRTMPKNITMYGWLFTLGISIANIIYRSYTDSYELKAQNVVLKARVDTLDSRISRTEYNLEAAARLICASAETKSIKLSGLNCKSRYPLPNP